MPTEKKQNTVPETGLVLFFLLVGIIVRGILLITKPEVLWVDDTFYSLGIARNIALGNGATHDGIHLTNGFQPLYVWLMVPFFRLTGGALFSTAQIGLALLSLFNLAGGFVLYWVCRQFIGRYGAIFVWISWMLSPYVISGINGLETSLTFFLLALAFWYYITRVRDSAASPVQIIVLGVLLGVTALARVDSLLFIFALSADYVLHKRRLDRSVLLLGVTILLVIAPWLWSNWVQFGSPIPESGNAIRLRSLQGRDVVGASAFYRENLVQAADVLHRYTATSFVPLAVRVPRTLFFLALLMLFGGLVAAFRHPAGAPYWYRFRKWLFLYVWVVALIGVYTFYQHGVWFFDRYFYALLLPVALLAAEVVELGLVFVLRAFRPNRATWQAALAVGIVLWVVWLPWSRPPARNPILTEAEQLPVWTLYQAADWLEQNTAPESIVAAYQSGIMGYFSQRTVLNLDGVVNASALPHLLDGTMHTYLQAQSVDYLIDWEPLIDAYTDLEQLPKYTAQNLEQAPLIRIIHLTP
jgi:hypothetical protein